MTEYSCSVCHYSSTLKEHIVRHINKKKSCGLGIKEIIKISIEINCEFCNKNFASTTSLKFHIKNNCKFRDSAKDEEIKKLKEELKEAKSVTNNNINNNNTVNINFIINNYEDTALDKLTDKIYNKIIRDSDEIYQIIPRLIKEIHFNPNIPENHNVYLSNRNKNSKHLSVFRNKHWEITDKNTEINNLISDKETNLSDWIEEKGEKYPETMEKFNEYIEQKYDNDIAKLVKEEVELLLYNGRNMIRQ